MKRQLSLSKRIVAYAIAGLMVVEPAIAGTTDISSIPLASSSGASVLPNLLFTLDASGSMDWDFTPDYVHTPASGLTAFPCMPDSNGSTDCIRGDPPYEAGGAKAMNGIGYDPDVNYLPGFNYDGTTKLTAPLDPTAVPTDAYGVQSSNGSSGSGNQYAGAVGSTLNITTGIQDKSFCNSAGICKRNGADTSGNVLAAGSDGFGHSLAAAQFPYRVNTSNSSSVIFGLPEMMAIGTGFSRTGSTVKVTTVEVPSLTVGDKVFVTGSGTSEVDLVAAAVTAVTATPPSFEYTSTGTGTLAQNGSGSFSRSGSTVTVVASGGHNLAAGQRITTSTGNSRLDATNVAVAITNSTTFTYTVGGSRAVSATPGTWTGGALSYRKHSSGTFSRSGTTVTVNTSAAHGLATNDVITTFVASGNAMNATSAPVTVATSTRFTYAVGTSGAIAATAGFWVRNGLYNVASTVNGPALAYTITPVEYCSDVDLTNCQEVIPPAAPPANFFPAYVRYCQTQALAVAPGAVTGNAANSNANCRAKYVNSGILSATYLYPRYGWFNRETIKSSVATYGNRPHRNDCSSVPTCTYAEEIQNYARWFTYYRSRMQMMKTAAGRAFISFIANPSATPPKPNALRVGFITINPGSPVSSTKYLKIDNFNNTGGATSQAANWYTTFYAQNPNQSTPLREALSRAGWIFAGKLGTGLTDGIAAADDPVQASCQRNYTILTTDGFWNGNAGQTLGARAIGNRDSTDPTVIAPYSQAMVDRATTVTFDGGGASSSTVTPTSTIQEQVACKEISLTAFSNNTSANPQQTLCGCNLDEHRVKQRDILTGSVVTSVEGQATTTTTGTVTNFTDATACEPMQIRTDVTPTTTLEQIVCTGTSTATAFTTSGAGNGALASPAQDVCGCINPNFKRVKQRTIFETQTVITKDGTQTSSVIAASGAPTTFQDITACNARVDTTTTAKTEREQSVCQGTGATTFGAGANGGAAGNQSACACTALQHAVIQRTMTYTTTQVTTDGVAAPSTNGSYSAASYTVSTACNAKIDTTTTPETETEQVLCQGNAATTFSAGSLGTAGATQTTCGCGGSGSGDKAIRQRRLTFTNTLVKTDGVTTSNTNTAYSAPAYTTPTACQATVVTTSTPVTQIQENVCGTASTSFAAPGNGGTNGQFNCSCSSGRTARIQRTTTWNSNMTSTNGGAATGPTLTANLTQTFSTLQSCSTGAKTAGAGSTTSGATLPPVTTGVTTANITLSPNPTVTGTASTSSTGATVGAGNISLSPNPRTTSAAPSTSSTGSTITSASFTITPNPKTAAAGATVTTTTGSLPVIALSPNPKTVTGGLPVTTTTPGGTSDTLADVAMYYYQTDLRGAKDIFADDTGPALNPSGDDVSANDVPTKVGAKDFAKHQHMVTFTVGLVDGLMRYQPNYDAATTASGDYSGIKTKSLGGCFWSGGAYCDWPAPTENDPSALDDLWHAAVNGRGVYYQATDANALSVGLQGALTTLNVQNAAAAASATSSPNVTQSDNQIFSTTYETTTWSGKIFAQTINAADGTVGATHDWDADTLLLSKLSPSGCLSATPNTCNSDTRKLKTWSGTGTDKLKDFTWANMTTSQEQGFFQDKCNPLTTMTQCAALSGTATTGQQGDANNGANMLGFLRGQTVNENILYRKRTFIDQNDVVTQTILGDTITAKPAFVRRPTFNYGLEGGIGHAYNDYINDQASRAPRVFVGANDGYLHAFDGATGVEAWAYAPRFLLPGLYQLADTAYASLHRYFVDGTPETADVLDKSISPNEWKTILVGGAAGGGRGYYALDVTDADNPKGLWEFCSDSTLCSISDADLGLTYGNPLIGKRKSDGKWVVVVTSGLNNVSSGSGIGYFYVLDAISGAILNKVSTGVGNSSTPAGLMKVSAFFDNAQTDATFEFVYGGDQLGNVWRLDMGSSTAVGACSAPALSTDTPPCVTHMATLTDGSSPPRAQPITTRPTLTHIGTNRVMYFATGRYLGNDDLDDPGAASGISWQQTIYAFKDKDVDYDASLTPASLRLNGDLVAQTLNQISAGNRGISSNPVDWNTNDGWMVDLAPTTGISAEELTPGERVNIDPRLVLGTLVVISNTPKKGGSCSVGGSSMLYALDFKTGSSLTAGGVAGSSLGDTIAVGMAIVQLPDGSLKDIITGADTSKTVTDVDVSGSSASVKRFSYRER